MKRIVSFFWFTAMLTWLVIFLQGASCKKEPDNEKPDLYGTWIDTVDGAVYRTIQLGDQYIEPNMHKVQIAVTGC